MKNQKLTLYALVCSAVTFSIVASHFYHNRQVESVRDGIRSGDIVLSCFIDNQDKIIDADKIVDIDYDNMLYKFTNGSAKNCTVVKNNG